MALAPHTNGHSGSNFLVQALFGTDAFELLSGLAVSCQANGSSVRPSVCKQTETAAMDHESHLSLRRWWAITLSLLLLGNMAWNKARHTCKTDRAATSLWPPPLSTNLAKMANQKAPVRQEVWKELN